MNDDLRNRTRRVDGEPFIDSDHSIRAPQGSSEPTPSRGRQETVAGLFDSTAQAVATLEDFVVNGYERNDMTLIANNVAGEYDHYFDPDGKVIASEKENTSAGEAASAGGGIGALLGGTGGVLMGLGLLVIPGIGPALAAGPIIAGLVGAGAGAMVGGVAGALAGSGLPQERAEAYAEGVRRGGTLLLVHAKAGQSSETAYHLMRSHKPIDIDERARDWEERGWSEFDPDARPYTHEEVAAERERYQASRSSTGRPKGDRKF